MTAKQRPFLPIPKHYLRSNPFLPPSRPPCGDTQATPTYYTSPTSTPTKENRGIVSPTKQRRLPPPIRQHDASITPHISSWGRLSPSNVSALILFRPPDPDKHAYLLDRHGLGIACGSQDCKWDIIPSNQIAQRFDVAAVSKPRQPANSAIANPITIMQYNVQTLRKLGAGAIFAKQFESHHISIRGLQEARPFASGTYIVASPLKPHSLFAPAPLTNPTSDVRYGLMPLPTLLKIATPTLLSSKWPSFFCFPASSHY
jgi:hypothetical protein